MTGKKTENKEKNTKNLVDATVNALIIGCTWKWSRNETNEKGGI